MKSKLIFLKMTDFCNFIYDPVDLEEESNTFLEKDEPQINCTISPLIDKTIAISLNILNNKNFKRYTIAELYFKLTVVLPDLISKETSDIEVCDLCRNLLGNVLLMANEDVGHFHQSNYSSYKPGTFLKPLSLTVKELFLIILVKYYISYRRVESYEFLECLLSAGNEDGENSMIKLSTIMEHRFDEKEYEFKSTHISYLVLRTSNLQFFKRVVWMARFLKRKECLYIDYPQYYELTTEERIVNGRTVLVTEQLVKPLALSQLHYSQTKSPNGVYIKDSVYYSNFWKDNEKLKTLHSNSIMAILSHIKYKLEPEV